MINNENKLIANSLWMETSELSIARQTKEASDHFDVAIIGGGLSGCSVAYHCANLGLNVCILEKETIGWGASGRNGGQVNPGLKELPESIISHFVSNIHQVTDDCLFENLVTELNRIL
jgi:glycerol-3-phosphate dehydrogenase